MNQQFIKKGKKNKNFYKNLQKQPQLKAVKALKNFSEKGWKKQKTH